MGRPRGNGIKIVRRKQADGTIKTHLYIRPREPLGAPAPGTIEALCVDYLKSVNFKKLAPATQAQYRRSIERFRLDWGAHAARDIKPENVQALKEAWQDQPAKANLMLSVLSVLYKYGISKGLRAANPAVNPGRLPPPKRIEIWSRDEEQRILAAFRPRLQLAFNLLLYTLQRLSDVLEMRRERVTERDGRLFIAVKQAKTNTLVDVPVHANLAPLLRERLAETFGGPWLVPSPEGRRWLRRNFSRAWDRDLRRANFRLARELFRQKWTKDEIRAELQERHRQRRDLRRTGIVRLAEAGATTPQIAAISGHAIDYCQRIIDTYLPRRTEVAIGGIETWERDRVAQVAYVEFRKPIGNRKPPN